MKKETEKTKTPARVRAARRTRKVTKELEITTPVDTVEFEEENNVAAPASVSASRKYLVSVVAILIIAALAIYKFQYLIIPAKVNGTPIYIWSYISYLHKTFGKDAIQTMTTQAVIDQEIAKSKVSVSNDDIQKQVDIIDKQASASGGLQAMLAAQQMTIDQLREQIRIQLAVKKILADKIAVSDAEVDDAYTKNKDFFKNVAEADAKAQVRSQLENQKFQKEASSWLTTVKSASNIVISYPGLQ